MKEMTPDSDAPEVPTDDGAGPPKRSAGQIAIAITVALLGFLLVVQLQANKGLTQRLSIEREQDLGQILGELQERSDRTQQELVDLQIKLAQATGSKERQRALESDAREQLLSLQILLGVTAVKGSGIEMTIEDPLSTVGPDVILDAIEELRDAGAESIQLGPVRVVASTAFAGSPGAVTAAGRSIARPYRILAIGDSSTLAEAMRIPGGVVDTLHSREGASVRINEERSVRIEAVSPAPTFRYARPRSRR
jgi:uncharacterized protein YlxW (UPF0749 family)